MDFMENNPDLFTISPEDKIPEKGKILISEPFLPDTFFNRTIVYLADHNEKGSIGFILNKKLDLRLCDAITGFDNFTDYLFMGGPVSPDTLHYIHNVGDMVPDSIWVNENIFMGGDLDVVRELISSGRISKANIRFFLGYSGWSAGQLEKELSENSWVIAKVNPGKILDSHTEDSWKRILRGLNNKYRMWADFPESPDMN
jgi:putative transcriptional regulator